MAHLTPAEIAVNLAANAAVPAWEALPCIAVKAAQVRAAVAGHSFDADGMTAALQAFNTGPVVPDVDQALAQGLI